MKRTTVLRRAFCWLVPIALLGPVAVLASPTPATSTRANYHANRAAIEARAQAAKNNPERRGRALTRMTPEQAAERIGCPEGTGLWRRGKDTEICAWFCTSDIECVSGERCRVWRPGQRHGEDVFADDVGLEAGDIGVCDPFWEPVIEEDEFSWDIEDPPETETDPQPEP